MKGIEKRMIKEQKLIIGVKREKPKEECMGEGGGG